MKAIKIGYSLSGGSLLNTSGVTQALPRYGINDLCLYNIFDKSYEVVSFVDKLRTLIQGQNGILNIMLTIDSAPFDEMTDIKKLSLPTNHQSACSWINRFTPDNEAKYVKLITDLITELTNKNLLQYISWQLWQEPDSAKYFHGNINDFIYWTGVKYNAVKSTNRPIYIGDFTSRKLNSDYRDWVNTTSLFNQSNVHYSSSIYPEVKNTLTDISVNYPTRNLSNTAITAYSIGTSTTASRINSPLWMVRIVEFLKWAYNKPITSLYFWNLVGFKEGLIYSAWTHLEGGGWKINNVWNMQLQLLDVIKGGYEPTSTGIRGLTKSINITDINYTIV